MNSLCYAAVRFYASSIGKKLLVALSALALLGFLVGHLAGNLLVFAGPDALNAYAVNLHSMGALLWVARIGLLGAVAVHIIATLHLAAQNRAARPQEYEAEATLRATKSSRIMVLSGLTILAFVIYHLMHFTWGTLNDYRNPDGPYGLGDGRLNVYKMVVDGFSVWANSLFYLIALGLLCSHLSHGVSSIFQTLGITTPRTRPWFKAFGWAFALVMFAGFASIPVSILMGWVK